LDISHITATTPQAKGRVERVNKTLQDRLIKEMRLRNINTIEEANEYLEEYIKIHNNKFSKEPVSTFDAHRPLETDLSRILCRYEERTLLNDLSIHFHSKTFQICEVLPKKSKIEVRLQRDDKIRLFYKNQELTSTIYEEQCAKDEAKVIEWHDSNKHSKQFDHPWKKSAFTKKQKEKELARWELNYKRVV
jgi:hypothetical protein